MLNFYGKTFSSRLLIGSALYPSPAIMQDAIRASGANIVTVSLRREAAGGKTGDAFWSLIRELDVTVLPNTAGCRSVREAVTTAKLARELFGTPWIKLEVIADNDTLQPDVVGLVEAAGILIKDGFEVFPYCTEDLSVAMRLVDAGCKVVMPWAAPIGSAKGITNRDALKLMRERLPDITLVVDAGLGAPSHAAHALELGYDAVLLNTAIAKAADPVAMANAFRLGVEAGRTAYEAGLMEARDFASPSTPVDRDTVLACRILINSIPSFDNVAWVTRLALLGVGTIQLRAKDLNDSEALQIVTDALEVIKGTRRQTRGQRLLARGDRRRRKASASRPGRPRRRRPRRNPQSRADARHLHP